MGYTQPIELRMPEGASIAATDGQTLTTEWSARLRVGLQVGQVYRFEAQRGAGFGEEFVYPTVEVIDRTYPPCGREHEFPIPIEITEQDLLYASEGALVTRVIYVENPHTALPVSERENGGQQWFEAKAGDDPLVLADQLGRPVAILRIGNRSSAALAHGQYGAPTPMANKPVTLR